MKIKMSDQKADRIVDGIDWLIDECHRRSVKKGFWDNQRNVAEMLMLAVTELSEGLEAFRDNNAPSDKIPEYSGLEEEVADAIIRLMDMSGGLELRIGPAIVAKLEHNEGRAYKHGKDF